ncbi:hypothetical protein CSPX01_07362 [Colletotrichum filicis]|nr:hypothetical protein CSPX01_07362 [Colletotrichum filicis]
MDGGGFGSVPSSHPSLGFFRHHPCSVLKAHPGARGMGAFAGWARATPKIQAAKNKGGGGTNSLSLEEDDESTIVLANLRLTRRRYGNAEMRLRTGFHARSKCPRRVQPIKHRTLDEAKKPLRRGAPYQYVWSVRYFAAFHPPIRAVRQAL